MGFLDLPYCLCFLGPPCGAATAAVASAYWGGTAGCSRSTCPRHAPLPGTHPRARRRFLQGRRVRCRRPPRAAVVARRAAAGEQRTERRRARAAWRPAVRKPIPPRARAPPAVRDPDHAIVACLLSWCAAVVCAEPGCVARARRAWRSHVTTATGMCADWHCRRGGRVMVGGEVRESDVPAHLRQRGSSSSSVGEGCRQKRNGLKNR